MSAPAERIWALLADSKRWPEFYRTHDNLGKLRAVEYLGRPRDEKGTRRRMFFAPALPWDEEITRFEPPSHQDDAARQAGEATLELRGVRNPGMKYWQVRFELVPGKGFTTVRWEIFYDLAGAARFFGKKRFKAVMEDVMLTGLLEIDRIAGRA
ncbi:MAG: SRPBCC family protein [Thermoplasmatota archaeon]